MHLFLVRHGKASAPGAASDVEYAPDDTSLGLRGLDEALLLGLRLRRERPTLILSSYLTRAEETARLLEATLGIPLVVDPRLREWTVPKALIGLRPMHYPGPYRRWLASVATEPDRAFEDGESLSAVLARLRAFREEVVRCYGDTEQRIIVVTHYNVGRLLGAQELLGADATPDLTYTVAMRLRFANGALAHFRTDPEGERMFLRIWNDRGHLDQLEIAG